MSYLNHVLALGLLIPFSAPRVDQFVEHHQDEADGYEAIRARELTGLITRLAEHAEWCKKKKLWLQRALAYEALLKFDPDHEEAHRGLGHKKLKDGSWVPAKKPKPVDRSKGKKDLEEALVRRAAISQPFIEALQELVTAESGTLNAEVKRRIMEDLLAVDPDNAWARGQRYEVKHEGKWVMMELTNTEGARAELREFILAAREELEPARATTPNSMESDLGLDFVGAFDDAGVRILGTVEEEEILKCSENLRVVRAVLKEVINEECNFTSGFTYFLLRNKSEQMIFLSNHPEVRDTDRAFYASVECAGILPKGKHFGSWADVKPRRLDSSCRQAIANLLLPLKDMHDLQGWEKYGWVFEGVGHYFTHKVVGTHLTWYIAPSRYLSQRDDALLRAKMANSKLDWLQMARDMMEEGTLPQFHTVVGRSVNRLSTEDLLTCNAAIAFLVEGRPGVLPKILKKIGKGRTAHETFLEELGLDLLQFDERLRMWLVETAD